MLSHDVFLPGTPSLHTTLKLLPYENAQYQLDTNKAMGFLTSILRSAFFILHLSLIAFLKAFIVLRHRFQAHPHT